MFLQGLVGYSPSQLDDLLVVRCLFIAQVNRLLMERNSLLDRMATHSDQLANVRVWAERLQQNIVEEHEMYIQFVAATYLGVRLCHSQCMYTECMVSMLSVVSVGN